MEIYIVDSKTEKFIRSLDKSVSAKVSRTFDLLEQFENSLGMPHSKPIGDGLFELRISGTLQVRFLYIFDRNRVAILHGFIKKTDKILDNDLRVAFFRKKILEET